MPPSLEELAQRLTEPEMPRAQYSQLRRAHEMLVPPTTRLRDGSTGYFTPGRLDQCFAAAVATVLQRPLEELPDTRIEARLQAGQTRENISRRAWVIWDRWARREGQRMNVWNPVPAYPDGRWVGIIEAPVTLQSHTVACVGEEVLHDPTGPQELLGQRAVGIEDVSWGISFCPAIGEGTTWRS